MTVTGKAVGILGFAGKQRVLKLRGLFRQGFHRGDIDAYDEAVRR